MKAIVVDAYGDPSKLVLREVPEPAVGPNEIKVRVAAAGLNPIDWKLRGGAYHAYMPLAFPAVLGRDVSGEVVAVGSGVTAFAVGARVLGFVNHGYAEFAVAPFDAWAAVPATMDLVDAAALPLAALTGAQLIEEAARVQEGQSVLVTGATGAVGRVAVFVAKARGAKVYAGVRGAHAADAAKLRGDAVVAVDDVAAVERVPPLDAIADTVGGEVVARLLGKVKAGGTVGSVVGEPAGAKARGLVVRAMLTHADGQRLAAMAAAVADGKLIIPIARRFPLSAASEAHRLAERGAGGKILLTL